MVYKRETESSSKKNQKELVNEFVTNSNRHSIGMQRFDYKREIRTGRNSSVSSEFKACTPEGSDFTYESGVLKSRSRPRDSKGIGSCDKQLFLLFIIIS